MAITPSAKNSMILTLLSSEVSSALTNLREHVKKSLNVYDTWFVFYIHFKKVTFVLPYGLQQRKWG